VKRKALDYALQNGNSFYAHSANEQSEWHLLKDHLHVTANIMKSFACEDRYKQIFMNTGLLHDLGKYQNEFQLYLRNGGRRGSVPHAVWGAALARKLRLPETTFVIDGHHKGIPDRGALRTDTEEFQNEEHLLNVKIKKEFYKDIGARESDFIPIKLGLSHLDRELFIRYLFSALTDSDWMDTESHFNQEIANTRRHKRLDCDLLIKKLEHEMSSKSKSGNINFLRNSVRKFALARSDLSVGFFSLSLPTGMGKTLTSVSWALRHAKKNGLKRIIIVLPFVNIIDQTAKELKRIFGEEWVLEHHSSYNEQEEDNEFMDKETNIKKLATENWDYPIIVTTTVQFFDSLFSNKPKRCRKVHNIAKAVVIFDEVQTLPKELIAPTVSILESMNVIMKTSFLFCTATQPAFEKRQDFSDGIDGIISLVEDPENLYKNTKRVIYKPVNNFNPVSMDELVALIVREKRSVLSIYNTKKNALEAYKCAKAQDVWESEYHLSTAMCPKHRKRVIGKIITDMDEGKSVFVASTQLIEAGVDLDFPCVFRESAPLESVIQSAGRCNREGKMNKSGTLGDVFIFCLEGNSFPDQLYQTLAQHTLHLLKRDINQLYTYDFFTNYYASVVRLFVDTDKKRINEARKNFNFATVAKAYHLIDQKTISLFIMNYDQTSRDFYDTIQYKPYISKEDYRYMQILSVQVFENFLYKTVGQWEEKEQGFYVWYGSYDKDTGITPDPILTDGII